VLLVVLMIVFISEFGFASFFQKKIVRAASPIGWSKTYGGPYGEEAWSVVQTNDGGYAVAGWSVNFSFGNVDVWLVKVDEVGNAQWNRTYGNEDFGEEAQSIIQTSDGGYALAGSQDKYTGTGPHDALLIKTDAEGNLEWEVTYGGSGDDQAFSVVQVVEGGYVFAGYTRSFGAGNSDFWLVKVDSKGDVVWNKTYGEDFSEEAYSLVQTFDGGYALAGRVGFFEYDAWLVKTDALEIFSGTKPMGC